MEVRSRGSRGFANQNGETSMSNDTNKPTHRLVRYYGEGQGAPHANVGAIWTSRDGRVTVVINTLTDRIILTGFPVED